MPSEESTMTDIDIMDVDLAWRQQMWTEVMNFLRPGHVSPNILAYRDDLPDYAKGLDLDVFVWLCVLSVLSHHDAVVNARTMHEGRGLRLWVTNCKDSEMGPSHTGPSNYATHIAAMMLGGIAQILQLGAGGMGAWSYTVSLQQRSNDVGVEIIVYPRHDSFMAQICKEFYKEFRDETGYTVNPALRFGKYQQPGALMIDWEKGATNVQSEDSP